MKHVQPGFHTGKIKFSYVDIRSRTFSIRILFLNLSCTHHGNPPHSNTGPCSFRGSAVQFLMCHVWWAWASTSKSGFSENSFVIMVSSAHRENKLEPFHYQREEAYCGVGEQWKFEARESIVAVWIFIRGEHRDKSRRGREGGNIGRQKRINHTIIC